MLFQWKYLPLVLLISLIAVATSCKKSTSPAAENPNDISLGNDSLVKRLNLKITDKKNLHVDNQLATDSKGHYIISGKKDSISWIGYFDGSGNEITTSTFTDEPLEATFKNDLRVRLNFTYVEIIKEVEGITWIITRMTERERSEFSFVENQIRVNSKSGSIHHTYTIIPYGTEAEYIYAIIPWYSNTTMIAKAKNIRFAPDGFGFVYYVYNNNSQLLKSFSSAGAHFTTIETIPVSMTAYITASPQRVVKTDMESLPSIQFDINPFPTAANDTLSNFTKTLNGKILKLTVQATNSKGETRTLFCDIDTENGNVL